MLSNLIGKAILAGVLLMASIFSVASPAGNYELAYSGNKQSAGVKEYLMLAERNNEDFRTCYDQCTRFCDQFDDAADYAQCQNNCNDRCR